MTYRSEVILGDCATVTADWPDGCVNLIMTSPPYAEKRANSYQTATEENYVEWFLERSQHFPRILTGDGSMIVNIKEHVHNCERSMYVHDLIRALRENGWLWIEEYVWRKTSTTPGKWSTRFRDGWERCLHFTRNRKFKMRQDAVMQPVKPNTKKRSKNLKGDDFGRRESGTGAPFGVNLSVTSTRNMVYPDNVIEMSKEAHNKGHPAVFPKNLPKFFVKLFTDPGDWVFDPFNGSGTTMLAAQEEGRNSVGTDTSPEYVLLARMRIGQLEQIL